MPPTGDSNFAKDLKGIPVPLESLPDTFEGRRDALLTLLEGSLLRLLDEAGGRDRMARSRAEANRNAAPTTLLLEPPYGRPPDYDPFMDRVGADALARVGGNPSVFEDSVPEFSYKYGFNPLRFLSGLILKAHPESLHALRKRRIEEETELRRRAAHAKYQALALDDLRKAAVSLFSGVARNPMIMPVSSTSLGVYVRPLCPGMIFVQVSTRPNFSRIDQTTCLPATSHSTVVRVDINSLHPSTLYYIRVCVEPVRSATGGDEEICGSVSCESTDTSDLVFDPRGTNPHKNLVPSCISGLNGNVFVYAQSWTLPATSTGSDLASSRPPTATADLPAPGQNKPLESISPVTLVCVTGFDSILKHTGGVTSTGVPILRPSLDLPAALDASMFEEGRPIFGCILGDLVDATLSHCAHKLYLGRAITNAQLLRSDHSILKKSGLFVAWNDSAIGSDASLEREEIVYRRYLHEKKKHMKKMEGNRRASSMAARRAGGSDGSSEPVLQRAPVLESLGSLLEALPIELNETETRNIYRSVQVGAHIELITLDLRRGMIGKYQNDWLQERLENSSSTWKIVLSGATLSLSEVDEIRGANGSDACSVEITERRSSATLPTESVPENGATNNQEVGVTSALPTGHMGAPSGEDAKKNGSSAAVSVNQPQQSQRSVSISHEDPLDEFVEGEGTSGRLTDKTSYYFKPCVQSMLLSIQPDLPPNAVDDAQSVKSTSVGSHASSAVSTGKGENIESIAVPDEEIIPVKNWREIVSDAMISASSNDEGDGSSIPTFNLSSGIVFFSGENCLSSNRFNSSSASNFAGGFVILNNPKDIGPDAFCAEVSIGSATPAPGKQFAPEPKLGPICVYSRPRDGPEDEVVATVRTVDAPMNSTASAGCALEVRFMQKSSGKLLYAARFVVSEPEVSLAENGGGQDGDV